MYTKTTVMKNTKIPVFNPFPDEVNIVKKNDKPTDDKNLPLVTNFPTNRNTGRRLKYETKAATTVAIKIDLRHNVSEVINSPTKPLLNNSGYARMISIGFGKKNKLTYRPN